MGLSPKQKSFAGCSDAFINIADGAVRSGKTHAALRRFTQYCINGPKGDMAVFGKTERTIRSNIVFPLQEMSEHGTINYVQGAGQLYIFGRRCWVIGVNDVRAEEKVRGMTLAGGLMNEVTLYPKEVFNQARARSLSIRGAKWFADCNPDSPYHWLYTDFLTAGHRKAYLKRWRFRLADNPSLPPENVEMIKAMHGPGSLFYRRNIDGEWVQAEGVIYDMFDERVHVVDEWPATFSKIIVGADYGTSTTTAFIMLGLAPDGTWHAMREYYWDAIAKGRQKTDGEYVEDLKDFLAGASYPDPYGALYPTSIEIDPSAASFRLEAHKRGVSRVRLAENDVLDGIRATSTALTRGQLIINHTCENLRKEMTSYSWDEKAQVERGEDKPLKQFDHACDALRYSVMRAIGKKGLTLVATA